MIRPVLVGRTGKALKYHREGSGSNPPVNAYCLTIWRSTDVLVWCCSLISYDFSMNVLARSVAPYCTVADFFPNLLWPVWRLSNVGHPSTFTIEWIQFISELYNNECLTFARSLQHLMASWFVFAEYCINSISVITALCWSSVKIGVLSFISFAKGKM